MGPFGALFSFGVAMAVTLTNLTDRAKQMADLVGSNFVSSAEWTTWINSGFMELYDIVVGAYEDYFTTSTTATISSGSSFALPAAFYKLRGIDYAITGDAYLNVPQYNFNDRNRQLYWTYSSRGNDSVRRYRLIADNVEITPEDRSSGTYRIWYVPAATALSSGSDTIPTALSKAGWEEYIVLYAAIKAKLKGEEQVTDMENQKAALAQRIVSMSANRNADQPERITDLAQSVRYGEWNFD
jgi:hypothetical protein